MIPFWWACCTALQNQFEGDFPLDRFGLPGPVNGPHAPLADHLDQRVLAGNDWPDPFRGPWELGDRRGLQWLPDLSCEGVRNAGGRFEPHATWLIGIERPFVGLGGRRSRFLGLVIGRMVHTLFLPQRGGSIPWRLVSIPKIESYPSLRVMHEGRTQ